MPDANTSVQHKSASSLPRSPASYGNNILFSIIPASPIPDFNLNDEFPLLDNFLHLDLSYEELGSLAMGLLPPSAFFTVRILLLAFEDYPCQSQLQLFHRRR